MSGSFEDAQKCLLESILFYQERGKSTRLGGIDSQMSSVWIDFHQRILV